MAETQASTAVTPVVKERFAFVRHFPERHPRATATLAAIGGVTVVSAGIALVKGLKKTDVTVTVGDDVVLDTASTPETD